MLLDEKIDRLKKEFSTTDFKVPFTQGSEILKSIEMKFIIIKNLTEDMNNLRQHHNNWADNIKDKTEVKSINLNNYESWVDNLDADTNYWTVIANQTSPSLKHMAYDCKPKALIALFCITQDDFFVVDKKYNWFSYFQVHRQTHQATIFKSGKKPTPFDIRE